jgi:hypothetical protein
MASIMKATKQNWLLTECVVPLAKNRSLDFASEWISWKRDKGENPKKWHLSVTMQMSDRSTFKREVLWTHGIPADKKKPSVISGIFCPASFVMTDFVTRIEFTIDQLNPKTPEIGIVKFSFKSELKKDEQTKIYASAVSLPPEDFSGWKKIEQKALSLVRVVGLAIPPFSEGITQKEWVYRITDFVRGDAGDVKPLKAGREHQDSARSKEALNRLEKLLKQDEKKPGGRITRYRLEELSMITQFSINTIGRTQIPLIRKRKETK